MRNKPHLLQNSVIVAIPKLPPLVSLEHGEEASHMVRLNLNHLHLKFALAIIFVLDFTRSNPTHERSASFPVRLRSVNLVLRHVSLTSDGEKSAEKQFAFLFEAVSLQHCKQFFAKWLGWFGYVADKVCCFGDRFADKWRLPVGTYRTFGAMGLVIGAMIWQIVI